MIKHVNFTGRRRIPRNRVDIEVFDGTPRTFSASIDLTGLALPTGAAVVLEATCAGSSVIERFEYGTVAEVRAPANRKLDELESENVFFTLKVIDRSEKLGRILGMAEHIRPDRAGPLTATGRQGILAIQPSALGDEIWKIDFSSTVTLIRS